MEEQRLRDLSNKNLGELSDTEDEAEEDVDQILDGLDDEEEKAMKSPVKAPTSRSGAGGESTAGGSAPLQYSPDV